ncbi:MAG: VWA domain-containing protein [Actinomycetota bacterium]
MTEYRYFRWDGTQDPLGPELNVAEIVDSLAEDLLEGLLPSEAISSLMSRGVQGRFEGLDALRRRLREARKRAANQGRLDGMLEQVREQLDQILEMERTELSFNDDPEARMREGYLESLPVDPAGRIAGLKEYDFTSPIARASFQELLEKLRSEIMSSYVKSMAGAMREMTPEQLAAMREMLGELNRMIEQRRRGTGPTQDEFDEFMRRHGAFFPENPRTLDELLQALASRAAALGRLMGSLSAEQRAELQALSDQMLADLDLAMEVSALSDALREMFPDLGWDQSVRMEGDNPLGLGEALEAIENLADLDELERQLKGDYEGYRLEDVDLDRVKRTLGDEAARDLDKLRRIERALEEAGVVSKKDGEWELTPRGIRALGQRALATVFERLQRDRPGRHDANFTGAGGEPTGSTRQWRFGDHFTIDVRRSVENAVLREGAGKGRIRLEPQDFEIAETESRTRTATVLLLDMSFSMPMRGNWAPAKRMALALHALITSQYPEDTLQIVGFSNVARVMTPQDLAVVGWEHVYGTNMEHAFNLAGRLLAKHPGTNKQVLLVTDGEPTAHIQDDGTPFFRWPPTRVTLEKTYKEALRLSKAGVTMNIFMLEDTDNLFRFIDTLARVVEGRVFAVHAEDIGAVVLKDYVRRRAG